MGLFKAIFGLSGPGKYMAAKNALIAKYTFESLEDDLKRKVDCKIKQLLIIGGIQECIVDRMKSDLRETQYFGMAAAAMGGLGIEPKLNDILFKNWWEDVQNPLVALTNAEKEIKMASDEILRKHRVMISISDTDK